jgi:hypothetical protein
MPRWVLFAVIAGLATPVAAAPISRTFKLTPPPARTAGVAKRVPTLADYSSTASSRGHARQAQVQILEDLIRHTPASEVEELNDYKFRLAEVLETLSLADPADGALLAKAGAAFAALVADPMFERYPKADLGLFLYVNHLQRTGKAADALKVSKLLLKQYPASKYVAEMYAHQADAQLDRGALDEAMKLYTKVLAFPRSQVMWYARYKLGLAHAQRGAMSDAFDVLAPAAVGGDRAIQELAVVEAARAYVAFGAADQAARTTDLHDVGRRFGLLRAVGAQYLERGKYKEAHLVYTELLAMPVSAELLCLDRADALRVAGRLAVDVKAALAALDQSVPAGGAGCAAEAELALFDAAYGVHTSAAASQRADAMTAAIALWDRTAASALPERRAAIARNRTIALWHLADASGDAARWADAAEALHASGADLAEAALDAWENAMRAGTAMPPALVARIRAGLDRIPVDRARVLRAGLR